MARLTKRFKAIREKVDADKQYSIDEALSLIKETSTVKFNESVDISINLGIDPRHADQAVRGMIQLPNGTGSSVRVAVFAKDDKAKEAKAAGADIVGAEDLMEKFKKGMV